ncbi:MAG: hypothetical protein HQM11_07790 [SAR324 cluster bacterium]|nr:hypothetical protein [SAR324 cluster bacterium]
MASMNETQQELYRHKKTDGIYEVICNAYIEATFDDTHELVVVYRNTVTGERWVRLASEFNDGRFERITIKEIDSKFCPYCNTRTSTYRHPFAKVWCPKCGLVIREEGRKL